VEEKIMEDAIVEETIAEEVKTTSPIIKIEEKKPAQTQKRVQRREKKAAKKRAQINEEPDGGSYATEPVDENSEPVKYGDPEDFLQAKELPIVEKVVEEEIIDKPNHQVFSDLLQRHLDNEGNIDYIGIRLDIEELDAYLKDLSINFIDGRWSRNEKLSYWINTYNAFTIKLILNNYPVSSIMKIDGGNPWDTKWIELGNNTYSLNQIENDIIRPQFNDPRIHFALNCAAKSCPPLANMAFTESNLNELLETRTKAFISNKNFNEITSKSVNVSRVFKWYSSDFGDLIKFLNKYSTVQISSDATLNFKEYNWDLNSK
jgi:hypothetical protein